MFLIGCRHPIKNMAVHPRRLWTSDIVVVWTRQGPGHTSGRWDSWNKVTQSSRTSGRKGQRHGPLDLQFCLPLLQFSPLPLVWLGLCLVQPAPVSSTVLKCAANSSPCWWQQ
jgi:hypothetical protein